MSKILLAFLSGVFAYMVYDYFFFIGLHLHYIQALGIETFFNPFFVDNQNIYLFIFGSFLLGSIIIYIKSKIKYIILTLLFLLFGSTLIPSIGMMVGEMMFMQKNVTLHGKKFKFVGDIYYIGRYKITFYDKELKKIIKLDKTEIKEKF